MQKVRNSEPNRNIIDSFNKAHSASYAMTSYQTAWLKHYYPKEWYASLLTSNGSDQEKVLALIAECKKKGIKILPPDINRSDDTFTPTDEGIRFRITTIKSVGDTAIGDIMRIRPIKDFNDLLERRTKKHIRDNVVVSLIKAGAFDSTDGPERGELLWKFEMSKRNKTAVKNDVQLPKVPFNSKIKLLWEKNVLGMYLDEHPMDKYSFKPLSSFEDNQSAFIGGEIVSVAEVLQKNGKPMAFINVDTGFGLVKILCFASNWADEDTKQMCIEGNIVLIRGKRSADALLFNSMEVLE